MLTKLSGLSVDHIRPLTAVWREATWHPHIAGQFTSAEKAQRFAARERADTAAGRPYALALHAAELDDLDRIGNAVDQAHLAAASTIPFPWYVRLRLPERVCLVLARWHKQDPAEAARLRAAVQEICPSGWSHRHGTNCPGCDGPADVLTPRPPGRVDRAPTDTVSLRTHALEGALCGYGRRNR
ncbi:hypothetical protein [Streptomyces sp. NPDC059378]|uniref:hypothetical protein n=1 Tax=Streptomyces sp. NPDC059378 TaxID=3346815 RepID=UPI0036869CD6